MTRAERRAAMPNVTEFVDQLRQDFPDLAILYATEHGIEWNKPERVIERRIVSAQREGKSFQFTVTEVERC